jgi:transcription elongation factor GreB
MATQPNYITVRGYDALREELLELRNGERPRVVQEVADAAAMGDRSENAEYIYGKKRLREIDRRLRFLKGRLEAAVIVDPRKQSGDKVYFGATVVIDEDGVEAEFQIVGSDEIDTEGGRISFGSPVGSALLGKELDDEVIVKTPGGKRTLTIVDVRYE